MSSSAVQLPRARRATKLIKPSPLKRNLSVDENVRGTDQNAPVPSNNNNELACASPLKRSVSVGDSSMADKSMVLVLEVADGKENKTIIGRRAARGVKLEKPTRLRAKSGETVDEEKMVTIETESCPHIPEKRQSLYSQMSHDSGVGDLSFSSRHGSYFDHLAEPRPIHDDLDWDDLDESSDNVFSFGQKQMQYTSFHVNQSQPFNSLCTDTKVEQPMSVKVKSSRPSRGRGHSRRYSNENTKPGVLNSHKTETVAFNRSQSMPAGCSGLDSVTESWDSEIEPYGNSGVNVISTNCDSTKLISSHGRDSGFSEHMVEGDANNNITSVDKDSTFFQISAVDPDATPKAESKLSVFKVVNGTNKTIVDRANAHTSSVVDFNHNNNNGNASLSFEGISVENLKPFEVYRELREDSTDVSSSVTEEAMSMSDESLVEQHYAWDLLDELADSMSNISVSKEPSQKLKISNVPNDLLKRIPKPVRVEYPLAHTDYPPDIEAIEAELNFLRDDEEKSDLESSTDSKTSGVFSRGQGKFQNSVLRSSEPKTDARSAHMVIVRQPLSHCSSQNDIWAAEETMPTGMYTAKGRRGMFRCYKMSQIEIPEPVHMIRYSARKLLEIGMSVLSKQQPDCWSFLTKVFPNVCLSQGSYFDCERYIDERGYVMEQHHYVTPDHSSSQRKTDGYKRQSSTDIDPWRSGFEFHRSISETASSDLMCHRPGPELPRKGFGIPRSQSVPDGQDIVADQPQVKLGEAVSAVSADNEKEIIHGGQTADETNFVKPPAGFVPPRKTHVPRSRSSSGSDERDRSRFLSGENVHTSVDLDTKCDVQVRHGMVSPGLKLFASATKQILSDRINRSISDPGNDASIQNNKVHNDLQDCSSIRDFGKRQSGNRSRSSSTSSSSSESGRSRRHSQPTEYTRNQSDSEQCRRFSQPVGSHGDSDDGFLNKDLLPDKCFW